MAAGRLLRGLRRAGRSALLLGKQLQALGRIGGKLSNIDMAKIGEPSYCIQVSQSFIEMF